MVFLKSNTSTEIYLDTEKFEEEPNKVIIISDLCIRKEFEIDTFESCKLYKIEIDLTDSRISIGQYRIEFYNGNDLVFEDDCRIQ